MKSIPRKQTKKDRQHRYHKASALTFAGKHNARPSAWRYGDGVRRFRCPLSPNAHAGLTLLSDFNCLNLGLAQKLIQGSYFAAVAALRAI